MRNTKKVLCDLFFFRCVIGKLSHTRVRHSPSKWATWPLQLRQVKMEEKVQLGHPPAPTPPFFCSYSGFLPENAFGNFHHRHWTTRERRPGSLTVDIRVHATVIDGGSPATKSTKHDCVGFDLLKERHAARRNLKNMGETKIDTHSSTKHNL